MQVLSKL